MPVAQEPITDFEEFMQELIERDDENIQEHDNSENEEEIDNDPVPSAKECIEMIKQLKRCFIFNTGDIPDSLTAVEHAVFKLPQKQASITDFFSRN